MSELTEFLLARITEDEAAFHGASVHWDEIENWLIRADEDDAPVVFTERRALAECEAKRQIIAEWLYEAEFDDCPENTRLVQMGIVLRLLAAVYSEHPDFDESGPVGGTPKP